MAASKAPNNTTIVSSAPSSAITNNNIVGHNFHELCRSCGKTNAELYDLFQTTNSPFSTSSTTCYTHLNNCSSTSSTSATATTTSTATSTTNTTSITLTAATTTSTAAVCAQNSSFPQTFDSVAATAKATAKGQSNMDNILQEMQIWQLLIKCNDGLPQRICAKCTAQFYMIHKFRRKCLKVQTQLRALYEEQQKFYERQQQKEKNVTVKDTTIEATSTPASPVAVSQPALLVKAVKPPAVMHKVNDLVNDNYSVTQQQEEEEEEAIVDNTNTITNTKLSVSFEANTGNTNDFIATIPTTIATTILPNNVETMLQKTEANEPTPTSSAVPQPEPAPAPQPAFIDKTFEAGTTHENCMVTTTGHKLKLKDEKIPLLRPAILLDSKRSPPLTLQQPLEQICDNDTTTTDQTTKPSKKPCLDQETLLDTHLIFKSNIKQNDNKQSQENDHDDDDQPEAEQKVEKLFEKQQTQDEENTSASSSFSSKNSSTLLLPVLNETETKNEFSNRKLHKEMSLQKDCIVGKVNVESLFVTKAALKAYTIPPPPPPPPSSPSTNGETKNRDHQKPITNSEAACDIKNANDNNNNNSHSNIYSHRYDNQIELNDDNICSSTSYSTPSSTSSASASSSSFSLSGLRKQKRAHNSKRKIIKYADDHNRRRRSGHCYKSNLKTAVAVAAAAVTTTKKARTIPKYGREMIAKSKKRSRRLNRHKLKRLPKTKTKTSTTSSASTSSTSSYSTFSSKGIQRKRQQQKVKMCRKKILKQKQQQQLQPLPQKTDIQMEDEMSSTNVSATSSTTTSPSSSSASSVSAISSTSSPLRATTPAATDLVRNFVQLNPYCKNTTNKIMNNNNNKKGNTSADRLSSNNNSCIMWKTKAAMKANANDMPVEVADVDIDGEPTSNMPEISLPYTATTATETTTTTTGSIPFMSTSLATDTDRVEEDTTKDKSSKNLYENQSNNNLIERYPCIENKVMSTTSGSNEVKDNNIKDESENFQKSQIFQNNLWPEEAKHQAHNKQQQQQQQTQAIEFVNNEQENSPQKLEEIKKDEELKRPIIQTPLANKIGVMKLIIERKRGARFKCRRKYEDETPAMHDNHEPTTAKRKKKSSHISHQSNNSEMASSSFSMEGNYAKNDKEEVKTNNNNKETIGYLDNTPPTTMLYRLTNAHEANENNTEPEDENKENPIAIVNNYEFDSDSNVSVYRDPLLLRNEMLEEDTHLTDFSKTQLSLQTECTKEMYKLYKEKTNFESPKKLIVRVPLTSLTQDFKKLHLTMEDHEYENAKTDNDEEHCPVNCDEQKTHEQTFYAEVANKQQDVPCEQESCLQANISSSQSDLLGFSQSTESSPLSGTENSSQPIIEMMRYIEPPLCSASSKINDFINDFQNNCIDSSEIDDTCEMLPTLVPGIAQELSDEIRDVEDTLNGILSEMHDKDNMYTPRSGETDEFFTHSVYSPLTDSPTTPSQSFYAESPCTINSNPMSVSPFIHHNMDYNAMTPQSNHSSMGPGSSYMSSTGGSTGPHTSVYSEHYPAYNECYEETTQSELIGFQNDIPCFENIEIANSSELQAETTEEMETVNETDNGNNIITVALPGCETNNAEEITSAEYVNADATQPHIDTLAEVTADIQQQQQQPMQQQNHYSPANYQPLHHAPTLHIQKAATTPLITSSTMTQPHYIVTNTNQGPILIANSHLSLGREQIEPSFKPHNNNLQFVTLGQAMEANAAAQTNQLINNNATKINWPPTVPNYNQQPVLSTANGTTTYFINANGELYQANIPTANLQNPAVNTIFVPTSTTQTSNKQSPIDNNDNYMQAMQQQQQQQQQQQHAQQQNNGQSSQYIMLVNNLGGSPRYYATTNLSQTVATPPPPPLPPQQQQQHISPPTTVLFQTAQGQNIQNNNSNNNNNNTNQQNHLSTTNQSKPQLTKSTPVPITPALEQQPTDATAGQTLRQRVNQQLQKQIKQRQLQNLQPKTTPQNVTQKITLVCRFCHKRPKFKNNVDYSNHIINTHPAEKPYNCPHCPMHFCRRSERQTHVAQVHGSRYQCAQCGLSFCAQRTLDFHLQKHHANLGRSHHQHLQQQQQQQQQQQNSSLTIIPATYQLLHNNQQQQRLVRVEDVHVQVTGENKNKRSIDLTLDVGDGAGAVGVDIKTSQSINEVEILSHTIGTQQLQLQQRQQSRKLCCPDCNGDDDDCCGNNQNDNQNDNNNSNNIIQTAYNSQEYAGNESVNNYPQPQPHPPHVTIPSPEQTEPDSTTTLRHFRKRQLCEVSPHFLSASPSSSSSSSSSSTSSLSSSSSSTSLMSSSLPLLHNNGGNDNINLNHNSPDNNLAGDGVGSEQIVVVERVLRATHNCLLCEESFTNEIALRKHHHLAHGAATQLTACSSAATTTTATSMAFVCTICRRGFRMRNALQRHMETHDAEGRPYECNICQVRFPRPSQLTLHKLTVHKFEKPNSCRECGKQFGTESAMKAHAAEHEHEAARAKAASASETSTTSSSSKSQLSSPFYFETTSTNEQVMNLQSTTSGEDASSVSASTNSNNDALNNATQNVIVS